MAKGKRVKKPEPEQRTAEAVSVTAQGAYKPLPRFRSGCKNC